MRAKVRTDAIEGQRAGKEQIAGLDVLRFAAALLVMFYHLGSLGVRPATPPPGSSTLP